MGRPLRRHQPGTLYLVTTRCHQARFFLRPDLELNKAVLEWLARAQERFPGLRILAVCVLSNHLHMVVRDEDAELADWASFFLGQLARAVNRIRGRRGTFFERRYSAEPILDDAALIDRLVYVVANPVKAGLCKRARDWPGVTLVAAEGRLLEIPVTWVDRDLNRYERVLIIDSVARAGASGGAGEDVTAAIESRPCSDWARTARSPLLAIRATFSHRGLMHFLLTMLLLAVAPATASAREQAATHYLSDASARDALSIALDYVREERSRLGVDRADLDESDLLTRFRSQETGTTHIALRQRIAGLRVWNGYLGVNIARDGRVMNIHSRFARRARALNRLATPTLSARDALFEAGRQLGLAGTPNPVLRTGPEGTPRRTIFVAPALSRDPVPVELMWLRTDTEDVRLVWNLVLRVPSGEHWWDLNIDAETGEILARADWVNNEAYRVFPVPLSSPDDGPRHLMQDPADGLASPFGWLDDDGSAGADSNLTQGNNAIAREDQNGNDGVGSSAVGTGETFDFPLDLTSAPNVHLSASIVNAFYWTNILHDILYQYGFDEAAGNFQLQSYGRGGVASDEVLVDVQDGERFNNANFATPPTAPTPACSSSCGYRAEARA